MVRLEFANTIFVDTVLRTIHSLSKIFKLNPVVHSSGYSRLGLGMKYISIFPASHHNNNVIMIHHIAVLLFVEYETFDWSQSSYVQNVN